MNTKLQKWAEKKLKILIKWSREYDRLCKKEGIEGNFMVSTCFDRNYVSGVHAIQNAEAEKTEDVYLFETNPWFKRDEKKNRKEK